MIMFSHSQLFISKHFLSYPPPESFSVQSYLSHGCIPSLLFILLFSVYPSLWAHAQFFYSFLFSTPTTPHHVHNAAKYRCHSSSECLILFCTHTACLGERQPHFTTKFTLNKVVGSKLNNKLFMTYLKAEH